MSLVVRAPLPGRVLAVEDVPDPVFSAKIVGPGLALDPRTGGPGQVTAVSPIDGTVAKVHPHAFVVTSPRGRGVLVHLGLDTVSLAGEGFPVHTAEGATVSVGDPMVTWDPDAVQARGLDPEVPVILLEAEETTLGLPAPGTQVAAGDALVTWD